MKFFNDPIPVILHHVPLLGTSHAASRSLNLSNVLQHLRVRFKSFEIERNNYWTLFYKRTLFIGMTLLSLKITDIILTEIIIHSEDVSVKGVLLFVIIMAQLW